MTKLTSNLLNQAADCFNSIRKNFYEGAKLLHQIKTEELWKGEHGSFSEYLEQECKISDGFASKLIQVYEVFVLEAGFSQRKLEEVDHEKLYLSLKLPGTLEKRLIQAQTLTRAELKQQRVYEENGEECTHPGSMCIKCHMRMS